MLKRLLTPVLGTMVLSTAVLAADATPALTNDQRFEIALLKAMIDQNYAAMKVAALAASRATHPELQTLGNDIQSARNTSVTTLQNWLSSWYSVSYSPTLDNRASRRIDELGKLSGADFEKAFMRVVAAQDLATIEHDTDVLVRAGHADLINFGATDLGGAADEVVQLRIWLNQWYSVTGLRADPFW